VATSTCLDVLKLATQRKKKLQGADFLLIVVGSLIRLQQGFWCGVILSNAILIESAFR